MATSARQYVQAVLAQMAEQSSWKRAHQTTEAWGEIKKLDGRSVVGIVLAVVDEIDGGEAAEQAWLLHKILVGLLQRTLPFEADEIARLLDRISSDRRGSVELLSPLLRSAERMDAPPVDALRALILRVDHAHASSFEQHRLRAAHLAGTHTVSPLPPGLPWSLAAADSLERQTPADRAAWFSLLWHATDSDGGTPKAPWLDAARAHLELVGEKAFRELVPRWFAAFETRDPSVSDPPPPNMHSGWYVPERDLGLLKGLAWFAGLCADRALLRSLTALSIAANRPNPGRGPRGIRVSNAAIWALGNTSGIDALGQLAILRVRVRNRSTQNTVTRAFLAAAEREGLPPGEIEEMAVPALGLTDVGFRVESFGEHRCELRIGRGAALHWFAGDTPLKSVPAAVKASHPKELKELKADLKDVDKLVAAQRKRLDRLFLRREAWPFAIWRERYLDHPIVGAVSRTLLWTVGGVASFWSDGALRGGDGAPVAEGEVRLWHPLGRPIEQVEAWRSRLRELEVVQPFKQAWREVYILTPAEEGTGTHSNRFAAHLLRQTQCHALATGRGWRFPLVMTDASETACPSRTVPDWGLRAELWLDDPGGVDGPPDPLGTCAHVSTDCLRFYSADTAVVGATGIGGRVLRNESPPVPLSDVPPLVLSELLRDVDLFVSVCSVGTDPEWQDGGRPGWNDYWRRFAWSELNATARTRRDVLAAILPRLAIRKQAQIDGRWMIVEGKRGRYRIHIGSGNVQMLPAHRYLCIVPARVKDPKVWLPFEGDRMLAIVLSKALMLAKDDKIKDPSILAQLDRA